MVTMIIVERLFLGINVIYNMLLDGILFLVMVETGLDVEKLVEKIMILLMVSVDVKKEVEAIVMIIVDGEKIV